MVVVKNHLVLLLMFIDILLLTGIIYALIFTGLLLDHVDLVQFPPNNYYSALC